MTRKELGDFGERVAAFYLEKKGYEILCRNYCIKGGEIDIVAEKDGIIAFVEVKTRAPDYISGGFEALTSRKKRLIIKTAEQYSLKHPHELQPRFDAVEIITDGKKVTGFNYVENAFDGSGIMTIL